MSDYGRLIGPAEIEFRRRIDADIEKVWQFLVDPEKRKLWFCGGSTDDHVGGRIVMEFDHRRLSSSEAPEKYSEEITVTHHAEILEYDPPNRLAFTWFESGGAADSKVEISLSATADGSTELHLVHTGIVDRELMIGILAGWHGHFDLMAETMSGPRKTDFWINHMELEGEYAGRI